MVHRPLIAVAFPAVEHGLWSAGSVVVAYGLSCPLACGIFQDQGFNPCPLHWRRRRRQWHPTPVLLPGKSHGQRSLVAAVHGVAKSWIRLSFFTFTFHFHALEKEMATHSSVLAWRMPGTGEPGGLQSMGLQRVVHD